MTALEWKYVYDSCMKYGITLPLLDAGGFKDWHYCHLADYDGQVTGIEGNVRTIDTGPWSKITSDWDVTHKMESIQTKYGMIISTSTLEHVKNPINFVKSIWEALVDGGMVILTTPFLWHEHGEDDFWRFTPKGLHILFQDFKIHESKYINYPSTFKMSTIVASKGELQTVPYKQPEFRFQ